MLDYEMDLFDIYNDEYDDLHDDVYLIKIREEKSAAEVEMIMEEYCK